MTDISALEAWSGQVAEAAAKSTAAAGKQHEYINGSATTDVLTESGPVPSIAKQAVLGQAKVTAALMDVASQMEGAMTYDSTALGLLGTNNGGYFSVPSPLSKELQIFYRNTAGAAVEVDRTYNATAVQALAENFDNIDQRGGYLWGVLDLAHRLGLGLTTDGKLDVGNFRDVIGHILALEAKSAEERSTRSGYLWGVMDLAGRLGIALDLSGDLICQGRNILAELDAIKSGAANNKWITPSKNIASWGDSMSENNWQVFLRLLMPDRNIYAGGVGGQKSGQIARRQGGIAPMITIADNTIPAAGSVAVTVDVPFMNSSAVLYGHLYGVFGTLTIVGGLYMFTRSVPGVAVQIDEFTPFLLSSSEYDYDFRTTIIWAGNNDYQSQYRPEVDGNVTRMVEFLKPQDKRFIVIGMAIASYSDRLKGTPYYTDTMALHKKWRERWPNNFIDITPVLQRHYDPNNPTDVQNLRDGCTPSSLRKDEIHLNSAGNQIVADTIYNFMLQRGW